MNPTTQEAISLYPPLTLALATASVAAYDDFEGKTVIPPPDYKIYARFTGWNEWFGEWGQEERFGLIFKYHGPNPLLKRYIVAFRGTKSYSDLFDDLFWSFVPFQPYHNSVSPVPNVSSGFYGIYSGIGGTMQHSMQQQVFSLLPEDPGEVYITGHSLGGALSQLFTLDARVSRPALPVKTINFASARVGDSNWAAACQAAGATARIIRVVNYWDIVPDYPFKISGYESIGTQFDVAFSRSSLFPSWLSDHSLLNYRIVLRHCLYLHPQVWVGKFTDAINSWFEMYSTDIPAISHEEWVAAVQAITQHKETILRSARQESGIVPGENFWGI
ncbi:lipase family protein [Chitinophaga nivalis]|uniref:Lipase family protein n=1 Tax=Chitinophaga nivalis TaxID=2991709 RepID=A0ABT3IFD1_9BACT|nr:lipase family protein [Chitinophaga nivalis]MCW3467650.1 lipase family protein [Chitinophaga nivalis]MCW3482658.1 lipase family protein [Chitinophaga nivalis]